MKEVVASLKKVEAEIRAELGRYGSPTLREAHDLLIDALHKLEPKRKG